MPVPQHRNQKKTKRRRNTGHTVRQRRFLLGNPQPEFNERVEEYHRPGDWLANDYLEQPTFEERMMALAERRNHCFERPRSFLDRDYEDDPDDEDDFAGILDIEDIEDFI